MAKIIGVVILSLIAAFWFVLSGFHFNRKGFLINNAYIYASETERKAMKKDAYYTQSAIVFLLLGIIFLINMTEMIINTGWLIYLVMAIVVVTVIYAVVSSIMIEKR